MSGLRSQATGHLEGTANRKGRQQRCSDLPPPRHISTLPRSAGLTRQPSCPHLGRGVASSGTRKSWARFASSVGTVVEGQETECSQDDHDSCCSCEPSRRVTATTGAVPTWLRCSAQRRGLARAGGPDQAHDLTDANIEPNSLQHLVFAEALVQVVDEAISWPARVISATVTVDTSDESFSIMTSVLPYGGSAMRKDAGHDGVDADALAHQVARDRQRHAHDAGLRRCHNNGLVASSRRCRSRPARPRLLRRDVPHRRRDSPVPVDLVETASSAGPWG